MTSPIILLFAPTLYIFFSALTLLQFSVLLHFLSDAAVKIKSYSGLEFLQPVLTALVQYLERVFGPAYKFTPNPTQVMLVAVMLAVIVSAERMRPPPPPRRAQ